MRISPICNVNQRSYILKTRVRNQETETNQQNVNFNGNVGSYLGILTGGALAVVAAVTVAPVLICGAAVAGAACGMAGDKIEDKLRSKNIENNEE